VLTALSVLYLSFGSIIGVSAQTGVTPGSDHYSIFLGPYLGCNTSIVTNVKEGTKPKVNFAIPDIGAKLFIPFAKGSSIGAMLDLGYSQVAYTTYPSTNDNDANTIKESYSFFEIAPSIYLSGFYLGIGLGIPVSANAEDMNGNDVQIINDNNTSKFASASYLTTKIDVRLGGSITLFEAPSGVLKMNIQGSYAFSGLYSDEKFYFNAYENGTPKSKYNPVPATLSISFSWLFAVSFKE
jgi:hypothetical protein